MRKFLFAFLVCALAAGPAMAQSARGGIQGSVTDETGAALPGVSVVISSPDMQGTRSAVTDTAGNFRFPLLAPGMYKAVFSLSGYQRVEQESIKVPLEGMITLDVSLRSTFTEEVIVTSESPVIDVTSTTVGSVLSQQVLTDVPVGRDFKSATFLATGAVDGGGIADENIAGNASVMGASALENRYVVDQLDTTDVADGRAGTQVSTSFIEEMQVKTAGYEAEYGGALGGVVNMITKSGGNEFHGDVFAYFTNDSLWETAEVPGGDTAVKTVDEEFDYGFTFGGKFIEDKLWYFVGYNPSSLDQTVYQEIERLGSQGGGIAQVNDFIRSYDRQYFTGKLTWRLSEGHSLGFTLLGDPTDIDNDYYTTNYVNSTFVETNQFYSSHKIGGVNYGLNWNGIFSDNHFFEASYGRHQAKDENEPILNVANYQDQTSTGAWTNGAGNSVLFGGPGFWQLRDDRARDQLKAAFSWFLGESHEIKIGAGYNKVEYDAWYDMVGSSPAFCAPTPDWGAYEYDWRTGETVQIPWNCDTDGDGVMDGVMRPAKVGNRYRLRNGYYYDRNYKNNSVGKTDEYNIYAQDAWKFGDYFTVTIGVRAESTEASGEQTKLDSNRKLEFGFSDQVAPRAGFIWDVAQNGKSKVFAHYGKFYESIPLDINFRSFGNEFYDFYFYYNPADGGLPVPAVNSGELTYIYRSSSESTFLDPDVEPQYLEEYVLGGEYEVMTDVAVGVKYIKRELGQVIEDISVDTGQTYFITNPGGTYTHNPVNGALLDEPAVFPEATRDFRGVELSLNKRFSNNWQGYTSLLWSELEGNYEGLYSRDNAQIDPNITSKFDLPELLGNAYGMLQNDREWQFKAYGSYHFNFGLVAGVNMFYLTGNPVSKLGAHRTYGLDERFITPRGTEGRTPDWMNWDLHLAYPFEIGDFRLEAMFDVFNLLDDQEAVELDQRWTTLDPSDYPDGVAPPDEGTNEAYRTNDNWGEPLVYAPPRNIRVGLKFSW